ncbi:cytochrome P450 [Ancylobacter oerskovii]|uniref:Cytochrome P450 n=1 Tax=Ancylobacter oerskovii TaxID=459519 RepID=A0ABW4YVE8_9HYPH|nr:cytochrome P450 [Ancylobacter oerskovii]MBS7544291.1 cytochrome P450 [Ancylobacter oerskovii]
MGGWGYQRPRMIERRGADFFEPAHPEPRTSRANLIETILGARHSLLSNWMEKSYFSGCDSFRIMRRQIVLVNRPDAIRQVLVTDNATFERKGPPVRRALEGVIGQGLFISDGPLWAERRPLVADAVHKNRLAAFAAPMETVTAEFAERWAALPAGAPRDAQADMAALTAEIITRAVFGAELRAGAAQAVIDGFTQFQERVDSFNIGYFLGFDEGLRVHHGWRVRRAIAGLHRTIEQVVEDHLAAETGEDSLLSRLIGPRDDAKQRKLGVQALHDEAATLFLAGHETTATTLTWAWYLLANAPWAEARLHEEIDRVAGDRPVAFSDVPKLSWCRAVIDETMRLYPPIPIYSRQATRAARIGDIEVEPQAMVLVLPWLLHRARDLWEEPDLFRPERFLAARPAPFSYIPFSVGPRVCAGASFALTEAVLCLAMLAQRFVVRPTGAPVMPICRLTLRPEGGLPVTVERRH